MSEPTVDREMIARLRERYTADPIPRCSVTLDDGTRCGAELSVQSMGGGHATVYAHACPAGVRMGDWMEHYRWSKWTQYRSGDPEVLAVLDAFERLLDGIDGILHSGQSYRLADRIAAAVAKEATR